MNNLKVIDNELTILEQEKASTEAAPSTSNNTKSAQGRVFEAPLTPPDLVDEEKQNNAPQKNGPNG